jgi:hypothetical protein
MDSHPSQGAHTKHLRTLSKIFQPETQALGLRSYPATFRPGEPHILHPFSLPSTPWFVAFSPNPTANHHEKPSILDGLHRLPPTRYRYRPKGRESYCQFPFRQPLSNGFRYQDSTQLHQHHNPPPSPLRHRLGEGARTILAANGIGKGASGKFASPAHPYLCARGAACGHRQCRSPMLGFFDAFPHGGLHG